MGNAPGIWDPPGLVEHAVPEFARVVLAQETDDADDRENGEREFLAERLRRVVQVSADP